MDRELISAGFLLGIFGGGGVILQDHDLHRAKRESVAIQIGTLLPWWISSFCLGDFNLPGSAFVFGNDGSDLFDQDSLVFANNIKPGFDAGQNRFPFAPAGR